MIFLRGLIVFLLLSLPVVTAAQSVDVTRSQTQAIDRAIQRNAEQRRRAAARKDSSQASKAGSKAPVSGTPPVSSGTER